MKSQELALNLVLPYIRLELPGWGKIARKVGFYQNELWQGVPKRTVRGKLHGYQMTLDLSANWYERLTYALGRYHELDVQLLIMKAVRPGDSFIDIGANLGMITLLAARYVTPSGTVHSFEPNPKVFQRLQATMNLNQLQHVNLHNCGLSDQETTLTLSVVKEEAGMGTFSQISDRDRVWITDRFEIPIYRGDDILPERLPGMTFIKIDVEGFESFVIRGLTRTIQTHRPAIVTEVVAEHLERAGSSVRELETLIKNFGYEGFNLSTERSGLQHRLKLQRITEIDSQRTENVLWLHPENDLSSRLDPSCLSEN